jgi:excisionase family DNA binding protein
MNIITPEDAAKELNVSTRQVYRYCRDGLLPAVKIGRQWLIERTDFDKFKELPRPKPGPKSTK